MALDPFLFFLPFPSSFQSLPVRSLSCVWGIPPPPSPMAPGIARLAGSPRPGADPYAKQEQP